MQPRIRYSRLAQIMEQRVVRTEYGCVAYAVQRAHGAGYFFKIEFYFAQSSHSLTCRLAYPHYSAYVPQRQLLFYTRAKIRRAGSGYSPPARRAAHDAITCYFIVRLIIAAGRPLAVTASSIVPALRPARTAISALPSNVMRLPVP